MDRYNCFYDLNRLEKAGRDFRIRIRQRKSDFAVIAPHGGKIERGTSQLADAIAGTEHAFYAFEGLKEKNNHHLHITSNNFDEPGALLLAGRAHTVITIHGARGREPAVYTGGLNRKLEQCILQAMTNAGFTATHDPSPTRQGRGVTNICNRGSGGKGVQLELTRGLRRRLFDRVDDSQWLPNDLFRVFVRAMQNVLGNARITI